MPNSGLLTFYNIKAVPGYNARTNPFLIALDSSTTKLVLINTQTLATLDIAVLKKYNDLSQIEQGSI